MKLKSFLFPAVSAVMFIAAVGCQKNDVKEDPGTGTAPELAVEILDKSLEKITVSVNADRNADIAWLFSESADFVQAWGGNEIPPEDIFSLGEVLTAEEYPLMIEITEELESDTEYILAVAARNDGMYSDVHTESIMIESENMLSLTNVTKTSFTYAVNNVADDQQWYHTYFEKSFYEEEVIPSIRTSYGESLTEQQILEYALEDFGYVDYGVKEITWTAGDDNSLRGEYVRANIVSGQDYVAVAAPYDISAGQFGTAEIISFSTPESEGSSASVTVTIEDLTLDGMKSIITPDENVNFYFYLLFSKTVYDEAISYGEEFVEDYLKNYGYVSYNEYTDKWAFTSPGDQYELLILGVDRNGDTFLQVEDIVPPPLVPEISISAVPYDSEAYGSRHGYENLWLQVHFDNFSEPVDPGSIYFGICLQSEIDGYGGPDWLMENIGQLSGYYIMPMYQTYPDLSADLEEKGDSFSGVIERYFFNMNPLTPDTGYYIVLAVADMNTGEFIYSSYALARTNKAPVAGEDPDYQAYLGNWTLSGQSTGSNWGDRVQYQLRVEQLVENYSFKVYGWSGTSVGEEYPFIMNYNPDTKGVYIMGPQELGPVTGSPDFNLVFGGMILYGVTDNLTFCYDDLDVTFEGSIQYDGLTLFGRSIDVGGFPYDYRSMNYVAVKDDLGEVRRLEGVENDVIYFSISRDGNVSSVPYGFSSSGAFPAGNCSFVSADLDLYNMYAVTAGASGSISFEADTLKEPCSLLRK